MGGKRKKHKPTYKPKPEAPKIRVQPTEPPLLVFVSSLITIMKPERDTVARTIQSFTIARPWLFEYTPASSLQVRDAYLSWVRKCDLFVIVLGAKYSEEVAREYRTAVESNKPILAFIYNVEKDPEQSDFIKTVDKKRATYNDLADLSENVHAAVFDQLVSMARATDQNKPILRPEDTASLIENMPLRVRKPEEMAGYLVIGMENDDPGRLYTRFFQDYFQIQTPPEDLMQIDPAFEPVYIENLSEMNQAAQAIATANKRSRTISGDRDKIFLRELKREILGIASRHIMRQKRNEPEPDMRMPGARYQIWALEPNLARLFRLARLEGTIREPITIKRGAKEFLFKDADRYTRIINLLRNKP